MCVCGRGALGCGECPGSRLSAALHDAHMQMPQQTIGCLMLTQTFTGFLLGTGHTQAVGQMAAGGWGERGAPRGGVRADGSERERQGRQRVRVLLAVAGLRRRQAHPSLRSSGSLRLAGVLGLAGPAGSLLGHASDKSHGCIPTTARSSAQRRLQQRRAAAQRGFLGRPGMRAWGRQDPQPA